MSTTQMPRRGFLSASAAGLGYFFTAPAFSAMKVEGANDRLRVVGIGVGGKGSSDIDHAGSLMEVVGLCDIDENNLAPKAKKWPKAKTYSDFRKLIDEMEKDFDAATISTPDHTHAPAAARCIVRGKHVYVQKPLTHTVFEARTLRELAAKHKVCTQMGNQGTAADGLRYAAEFLWGGGLGQIASIHVWTNRPIWPQAPQVTERPPAMETPKRLDWEAFIGPAPMRPYAEYPKEISGRVRGAYHDFTWRGWLDFGTGALGDMACHTANMAFMGARLGMPTSVIAEAGDVNKETHPSFAHITFQFPKRDSLQACEFHWYEGKKDGKKVLPPEELLEKATKNKLSVPASGSLLVGEKGMLYSPNDYGAEVYLITDSGAQKISGKPTKLASNNKGDHGQKEEWVEAIKSNKPSHALSNFDYAAKLTETILLGNIAIALHGTRLDWNGEKMVFPNSPEATKRVSKEYRKGWDLLETGNA